MLELRYRQDLQAIQVTLTEDLSAWPAIRSAFEENAEEIAVVGAYSLRLPVWSFLSCRRALVYVLRKRGIPFAADSEVEGILRSATKHESDYRQSLALPPLGEKQLLEKLATEGFTKRTLTSHQLRNVLKLATLLSGATFSVPGAGKTTEALAFYYFHREHYSRLLVVCPKNAFAAWEEQVNLCSINPPEVDRLVGGDKLIRAALDGNAEIFLITYQQLPNVKNMIAEFMFTHPTFLFLDESHHIKRGSEGIWCSSVLSLAHLPVAKLVMTGTPLPNSPQDLVPQFNFIFPEVDATPENIQELIKPVFVRTTKDELGLREVQVTPTPIQLRPCQRNLYELLRSEEARQLANISPRDRTQLRQIGRSILRLLQVVSNPALLARADIDIPDELYQALAEGDGPKIAYACAKARKLAQQRRKVLIWSGFVENVETIASRLSDIGADFIHGGVEAGSEDEENTRERKIRRFHNDPEAYVLVANPAACAEGISLHTVCHHAIYVDRNYNAAQYLQSVDRIHRLGLSSEQETTVEILYSPDTVDDSVWRRVHAKINKMADVLNDHSLKVEPVVPDLEAEGLDEDDARDFLNHLSRG